MRLKLLMKDCEARGGYFLDAEVMEKDSDWTVFVRGLRGPYSFWLRSDWREEDLIAADEYEFSPITPIGILTEREVLEEWRSTKYILRREGWAPGGEYLSRPIGAQCFEVWNDGSALREAVSAFEQGHVDLAYLNGNFSDLIAGLTPAGQAYARKYLPGGLASKNFVLVEQMVAAAEKK